MGKEVRKALRLSEEMAARIDAARGDVSWSRWVERAIENELDSRPVVVSGDEKYAREVTPLSVAPEHVAAARRAELRSAHLPTCECAVCKPPK